MNVDLQLASNCQHLPNAEQFQSWLDATPVADCPGEVLIRIVDEAEMSQINKQYRHQDGATNVLSFSYASTALNDTLLGDLLLCAPVIAQEANEQHKQLHHHFAHLLIHGVLHLLGYDHIDGQQAQDMMGKEVRILQTLNIPNPY